MADTTETPQASDEPPKPKKVTAKKSLKKPAKRGRPPGIFGTRPPDRQGAVDRLGGVTRSKPESVAKGQRRNLQGKNVAKQYDGHWEPNETHLNWYYHWTYKFMSYGEIARDASVHHGTVCKAVHKVREWFRLTQIDEIVEIQNRHMGTLERVAREALTAWERSKEESVTDTTETDPEGKVTTKRQVRYQCGDSAYLAEARAALGDIRKLFGVDKPLQIAVSHGGGDELERVSGMPRAEALRRHAEKMIALAATEEAASQQAEQGAASHDDDLGG